MRLNREARAIAILGTRGIPARYGGFETFAEELATRLAGKGFEVTVFCEKSEAAANEYKGVKLVHVNAPRIKFLFPIFYDIKCMLKALKDSGLIIMAGYGAGFFFIVPRLLGVPVWVNMDGLEWRRKKWPWFGRLYLRINEMLAVRFASLLIADAHAIRDYLVSKYGGRINCHVIAYGAEIAADPPDENLLKKYMLEAGDYYLVVCRLEPDNHVMEIIEGFKGSATPKRLAVVGDHNSPSPYTRKILKMEDDRLKFIGPVYEKESLKALRFYCKGYFHGHSTGGTNPSLLEALGCGNAVIAHDNVFNREVAGDCAKYFSSPSQIPGIINTLEGEGADPEAAKKARHRIRDVYDWDRIAARYIALFKDTEGCGLGLASSAKRKEIS